MDTRPPPPHRLVATLADALGLAFELVDRHPVGRFVAVVDGRYRLVRLAARIPVAHPHLGPAPGPDRTVDLIGCRHPARLVRQLTDGRGGLLAISATASFAPFSPADLALYSRLRSHLGRRRIALLDWIRTDGDLYQSAAWATDPSSAWPGDPPCERSAHHGRP